MKLKPRNKVATSPLMKKGHAHSTKKDYDRHNLKKDLKKQLKEESPR